MNNFTSNVLMIVLNKTAALESLRTKKKNKQTLAKQKGKIIEKHSIENCLFGNREKLGNQKEKLKSDYCICNLLLSQF